MVLSSRRVYFLVTLLILGAIFCFTPLISLKKHENYALIDSYLDRVVSDVNRDSPIFLISLSIVLIPFVDLVLDFITLFYGQESSLKKRVKSSGVIRLTDVERLMFVLGVAIQSTVYFLSRKTDNHTVNLVIHCVGNANALLILGPIVIFLGRCTETFSQNRTTFTIIFPVIGVAVRSVSYFYRSDSEKFSRINIAGTTFILCGAALYGYCILLCCQKYYQQKLGSRADRELWLNSIFEPHQPKSIEDADYSTGYDNELYANYVPALHIISSVVICLSTSIRGLSSSSEVNLVWVNPDYVIICAEIMVLVIELRIRKNEITRGLVALLQSKKTYVRYISHELRTPLNTAFLGLKLLTNEFKASSKMRDVEHYDTLCDVNMSCTAAVSILNDLLCYEKLESGRMELHKETVSIEVFLNNSLSLFSAQSLECGVPITLDLDTPPTPAEPITNDIIMKTLSLQPHESVFVDRFKMDQVIRNLLSNALKFTPRGGKVTVKAYFMHDQIEVQDLLQTTDITPNVESETTSGCAESSHAGPLPRPLSYSEHIKHRLAESCRIATSYRHRRDLKSRSVNPKSVILAGDPIVGKLIIEVTDTGAGINEENQKRLFKEIIQFSPEKLQSGGGSGLGLWITAGILDLHDGGIRVHSCGEGTGTSFTVEIPMTRHHPESITVSAIESSNPTDEIPDSKSEVPEWSDRNTIENLGAVEIHDPTPDLPRSSNSIPAGMGGLGSGSGTGVRIQTFNLLVVDDSRLNRKMLLKCLKADGHTCWEAEDGVQAIAMVKERIYPESEERHVPFDAILMDFVMPNMDGPEATKQIRTLGYNGLIFGVTGNGLSTDVEHFLECGADKVLLKPLDIDAFSAAMGEMAAMNQGTRT